MDVQKAELLVSMLFKYFRLPCKQKPPEINNTYMLMMIVFLFDHSILLKLPSIQSTHCFWTLIVRVGIIQV